MVNYCALLNIKRTISNDCSFFYSKLKVKVIMRDVSFDNANE